MPRKPNFDFERSQRDKAKAAKKAAKLEAKAAKRSGADTEDGAFETDAAQQDEQAADSKTI